AIRGSVSGGPERKLAEPPPHWRNPLRSPSFASGYIGDPLPYPYKIPITVLPDFRVDDRSLHRSRASLSGFRSVSSTSRTCLSKPTLHAFRNFVGSDETFSAALASTTLRWAIGAEPKLLEGVGGGGQGRGHHRARSRWGGAQRQIWRRRAEGVIGRTAFARPHRSDGRCAPREGGKRRPRLSGPGGGPGRGRERS
ncbi:hypothetical protein GW17_00005908, partial [Ensete ventricosum]